MAEHMAALPKTRASPRAKRKPDMGQEDAPHAGKGARAAKPEALPAKPKPRPNHAPVQRAEAALADAEERHEEERSALAKQQAELDRARRKLEAAQVRERERLEHRLEAARDYYRAEEHTSELQSLMRISYAVFCLNKKKVTQLPRQ